mgnify:CR=1 FL=1
MYIYLHYNPCLPHLAMHCSRTNFSDLGSMRIVDPNHWIIEPLTFIHLEVVLVNVVLLKSISIVIPIPFYCGWILLNYSISQADLLYLKVLGIVMWRVCACYSSSFIRHYLERLHHFQNLVYVLLQLAHSDRLLFNQMIGTFHYVYFIMVDALYLEEKVTH